MGFKKFTGKGGSKGGDSTVGPRISLRKSATLGINHPATEKFFDTADHVELFNNAVDQKVGLHPVERETENSYKVKKIGQRGTWGAGHLSGFLERVRYSPGENDPVRGRMG